MSAAGVDAGGTGAAPLLEAGQIDDETVPHVVPDHSLVRFVHLLDGDDLHVGADLVACAIVEHLLRLGNAPDGGPGQPLVSRNQ